MRPSTLQEFVSVARADAAIQARLEEALQAADPAQAVLAVAHSCGWSLNPDQLQSALDGSLHGRQLEAIAGGISSPQEMFAESFLTKLKKID